MTIHQLNMQGKDKVEVAIERFKTFEPGGVLLSIQWR